MDPAIGALRGDVHVRDGETVAIAPEISLAYSVPVIDARDRIVMPGFSDGHFHLWNTILRAKITKDPEYMVAKVDYAPHFTPEIAYRSTRLGLLEALLCGITTVTNFNHNVVSIEHAEADMLAHHEVGLRSVFAYGTAEARKTEPLGEADILTFRDRWFGPNSDNSTVMQLWVTPGNAHLEADFAMARKHRLPIILHGVKSAYEAELLGPDLRVGHTYKTTPEMRKAAKEAGVAFSTSANLEAYLPKDFYQLALEAHREGVIIGISCDTTANVTADFFTQMRMLHASSQRSDPQYAPFTVAEVVEIATMGGARFLGMENIIGSLTPGKRGDIVTVRTDVLGMAPFEFIEADHAYDALVMMGQTQFVDTVVVDGRVLLRDGNPVHMDVKQVISEATEAWQELSKLARQ